MNKHVLSFKDRSPPLNKYLSTRYFKDILRMLIEISDSLLVKNINFPFLK